MAALIQAGVSPFEEVNSGLPKPSNIGRRGINEEIKPLLARLGYEEPKTYIEANIGCKRRWEDISNAGAHWTTGIVTALVVLGLIALAAKTRCGTETSNCTQNNITDNS